MLIQTEAEECAFPDWSVGFLNPNELTGADREVAQSLYDLTESSPGTVQRLMGSFRNMLPGQRPAMA